MKIKVTLWDKYTNKTKEVIADSEDLEPIARANAWNNEKVRTLKIEFLWEKKND